MTQLIEPKCFIRKCIHFDGVKAISELNHKAVCKAFPKGIPDEIAYGDNLHTKPFPGDNGITFEQRPSQDD